LTASRAPPPGPPNWTQLALGWIVYFSFGMVSVSLVPIITPVREELGISYAEMGFVLGGWQLVYIGAAAPAGMLIDRIGPKKALAIGAAIVALSGLLRAFADGFVMLFAAVAIFGFGGPIISSGLPKLIADWFTGAERGTASGIYVTGSAAGGVLVLALTSGVVMPLAGSWRGALLFYAAVAGLIAIVWMVLGRDSPQSIAERGTPPGERSKGSYRNVILHPAVLAVIAVGFAGFLANHGLRNWLPQILEADGVPPTRAGLIGALPLVTGILGSILVVPFAARRLGKRRPVAVGLLAMTGITMAAIMFTDGVLRTLLVAVQGFCAAAVIPLLLNTLMETPRVGARHMGTAGGLFFAVGEIGGTLGPVLVGLTADMAGSFTVGILMLSAVTLMMMLPALRIRV
jgi:cyanate permease